MANKTCRMPGCDREREEGRYCSTEHQVKYEHIKADADEARYEEQREVHHDDVPRGPGDKL